MSICYCHGCSESPNGRRPDFRRQHCTHQCTGIATMSTARKRTAAAAAAAAASSEDGDDAADALELLDAVVGAARGRTSASGQRADAKRRQGTSVFSTITFNLFDQLNTRSGIWITTVQLRMPRWTQWPPFRSIVANDLTIFLRKARPKTAPRRTPCLIYLCYQKR